MRRSQGDATAMSEGSYVQETSDSTLPQAERIRLLSIYALVRTAFSSERSLMAWIRTSVALYSFGFTLTKFVGYLDLQAGGSGSYPGLRRLGLILMILGIIPILPAMLEHLRRLGIMKKLGLPPVSKFSLPVAAAAVLLAVGILTLAAIIFNWSA